MEKHDKPRRRMRKWVILLLLVLLVWLYQFPVYKAFAQQRYERYAAEQGIPISDIETKRVFKDYLQGGYIIDVTYKSDPEHRYEYQYFLVNRRKSQTFFDTMYCWVYDNHNNELDDYTGCVYQPLTFF